MYSVPSLYLTQYRFIIVLGTLGTYFNNIWIKIQQFSFQKMNFKMSSAKFWPFVSISICHWKSYWYKVIQLPVDILSVYHVLTKWRRFTHICTSKLTIIGSDNGLSPTVWTSAGILLIGPLATNFRETIIKFIHFKPRKCIWKCRLKKWRPSSLGLDVLI